MSPTTHMPEPAGDTPDAASLREREEHGHSSPELRILSGLHRGAAVHPGQTPVSIGSDPECDIVLLDEGICGEHLVLEPDRTPGRTAWQVFLSDRAARAYSVEGEDRISGATLLQNELIRVGQVWLCIAPANAAWAPLPPEVRVSLVQAAEREVQPASRSNAGPRRPWHTRAGVWLIGLLALLVTGTVLALRSGLPLPSADTALAVSDRTSTAATQEIPTAEPVAPTRPPSAQELSSATLQARQLFKERGLARVSVAASLGQLQIRAELDEPQRVKFEHALMVLDKRLGGGIDIQAQMVQPPSDLPFTVQQVLMGPTSRVVLSDGRILHVGQSADGVKLVAVRPGKLQFMARRAVEVPW